MKLFQKWLGQEPEVEIGTDNVRHPSVGSSVEPEQKKGDEYDEDTSFNWLGNDQDDSSIPDSLRGTDEEKSSSDTVTVRTLTLTEETSYSVEGDVEGDTAPMNTLSLSDETALTIEEDAGIDPYNTNRLKVTKK